MSSVKPLDKEITEYLRLLNETQKQAVLGVIKTFAHEEKTWWNNKTYLDEMNKRFDEMESGKIKGISLDEIETGVRISYKKRKLKNS
jgi:hypothetical protein